MINSTMKASGKLKRGIITTPTAFLFLSKIHQGWKTVCTGFSKGRQQVKTKKADPYDYSFDKMPI